MTREALASSPGEIVKTLARSAGEIARTLAREAEVDPVSREKAIARRSNQRRP